MPFEGEKFEKPLTPPEEKAEEEIKGEKPEVELEKEETPYEKALSRLKELNSLEEEVRKEWPGMMPEELHEAFWKKRKNLAEEVEKAYDEEKGITPEEREKLKRKKEEMDKPRIKEYIEKLEKFKTEKEENLESYRGAVNRERLGKMLSGEWDKLPEEKRGD